MKTFWNRLIQFIKKYYLSLKEVFIHLIDHPAREAAETRQLVRFILVTVLVFFLIFLTVSIALMRSTPSLKLPNVARKDVLEAVDELQKLKLKVVLSEQYSSEIPRYTVISQRPDPGMTVRQNRSIVLKVSLGKKVAVMPNFLGVNSSDAKLQIIEMFSAFEKAPLIVEIPKGSDKPSGTILSQEPNPKEIIPLGKDIVFVVSRGEGTNRVEVKDYLLKPYKDVAAQLRGFGIEVRQEAREAAKTSDVGKIFSQSIKDGVELAQGDVITFMVAVPKEVMQSGEDKEKLRIYYITVPGKPEKSDTTDSKKAPKVKKKNLELRVTDQLGLEVALKRAVAPGENCALPYKTLGSGKVEIWVDGELIAQESF